MRLGKVRQSMLLKQGENRQVCFIYSRFDVPLIASSKSDLNRFKRGPHSRVV